ncbi:MAG: COX15/CtaA family protein, partial [Phycisphaerae bacterium]|nr:COX15/CtaA family protein [Phycisphaerae bacterium]
MSPKATETSTAPMPAGNVRALRLWLGCIAFLIVAMILVGGATRLTDSGLSITEWQPIVGAIPPLSDGDWQEAFEAYKQIPEYTQVNKGMSLSAFKRIYWWEWAHRFFGRLIGIAYAVPLFVFWLLGRVPKGFLPKLLAILVLGGLQGFFGWYMVQSGLVERVDVSHYRLALHLVTAFVILASLLWVAFELVGDQPDDRSHVLQSAQHWTAAAIVAVLFLQVIIGAFVAGLKAGLTHNTWPLMDGALIPDGLLTLSPWHLNLIDNETTVQFIHRLLAY